MPTVTVYSRAGCHLCEQAVEVLEALRTEQPFTLEVVDITVDPELRMHFAPEIPVIMLEGKKVARYRVDAGAMREWLVAAEEARDFPVIIEGAQLR